MTGFTDLAPVVREQTVKAVLTIITKLSDRVINGELLKYLAKTSNDEQPGIRTNTTICLGKIAKHLGGSSRPKVLIAAFTRSLRDPFVHARNAALLALAATGEYFSEEDSANRILPAVCPLLIDKEKLIRDQANKTIDIYLSRVRKASASMPETVLPPPSAIDRSSSNSPRMSTPQPNEGSWTGWAISSFTNKVSAAAGEIQSATTPTNGVPPSHDARSASAPGLGLGDVKRVTSTASASALHRQAITSPPLTSARTSTSSSAPDYFQETPEVTEDDFDAWGDLEEERFADAPEEQPKPVQSSKPKPAPAAAFDDNGEPDFAGWLAAQSHKKTTGSKPLPKGLAKTSKPLTTSANGRPGVGKTASTGNIGTGTGVKKAAVAAKPALQPKTAPAKTIDTKPKETTDEDGWDEW